MTEIWKIIPEFENYSVSNYGRIKTNNTGRIRKIPTHTHTGYSYIGVTNNNGKNKTKYVHQLVMMAFNGPYPSKNHVIHHKDGNKTNNNINNLEYTTIKQNNILAGNPIRLKNGTPYKKIPFIPLDGEKWKNIPNSNNQISNLGRVRRHIKKDNKYYIRTQYYNTQGYKQITIGKKCYRIHTLVANAFIGNPPTKKHIINHKDGNKENNNVNNLEWATHAENIQHAYDTGLQKVVYGRKRYVLSTHQVHQIHQMLINGIHPKKIAEQFPVTISGILRIKGGKYRNDEIETPEKISKIRLRKGTGRTNRKLSDDQIKEIYIRATNGESPAKIAKEFNISQPTVSNISAGRAHRKITCPTQRDTKHMLIGATSKEKKDIIEEYNKHQNITYIMNKYGLPYMHIYKIIQKEK